MSHVKLTRVSLCLLLVSLGVIGCGNKGPLYLEYDESIDPQINILKEELVVDSFDVDQALDELESDDTPSKSSSNDDDSTKP